MKPSQPPEARSQFSAPIRHYHRTDTRYRSASRRRKIWDDWVDGGSAKPVASKSWPKIVGSVFALLALSGIIAGLVIEMR